MPLEELVDDGQRARWKARLDAILRVLHDRKLALAAFEFENAPIGTDFDGGRAVVRAGFEEPLRLEKKGEKVELSVTAPDGTVLIWHLAPHAAP